MIGVEKFLVLLILRFFLVSSKGDMDKLSQEQKDIPWHNYCFFITSLDDPDAVTINRTIREWHPMLNNTCTNLDLSLPPTKVKIIGNPQDLQFTDWVRAVKFEGHRHYFPSKIFYFGDVMCQTDAVFEQRFYYKTQFNRLMLNTTDKLTIDPVLCHATRFLNW